MTLLLILLAAAASAPLSAPATRAEVAAQRAAVEQRFAREKIECEQRFAVSPCLEDLRQRRQDALAPLVRREQEFITEERHARAVAQAQRVKERQLDAAQDAVERRERVGAASSPTQPVARVPHVVKSRSPEQAERERRQAISKADAEAATRRAHAQERQQRAQQRVAEHEARQKSRTKPPAAPLPLPGASAASAPK